MAAKSKASKSDDAQNASLESNQHTDLEQKIDALLSLEEPEQKKKPISIPVTAHETQEKPTDSPAPKVVPDTAPESDSPEGPPLLPGEQLPVLEKSPEPVPVSDAPGETPLLPDELLPINSVELTEDPPQAEENPPEEEPKKIKFYESAGPKPVAPEKMQDTLGLETPSTSQAVDEIVAKEADELLSAQDREYRSIDASLPEAPPVKKTKKRGVLGRLIRNKWVRNLTILAILIGIGAAAALPSSRYAILNAAGIRSGASITVMDETTGQPLKNAEFTIDGVTSKTDKSGEARLENLKLGPQTLHLKKPAFAEISQTVTLGWGSNPLGELRLKPVGLQYRINVVDFLSKKPLTNIEATAGEASAVSNDKGEIVITVPRELADKESVELGLSGDKLRSEKIKIQLGNTATSSVEMVPSRKHTFISKRTGSYDVYKIDVDGKNEERILAGTGSEKPEAMALSVHPSKNIVALISTRSNQKIKDGVMASTLTIINLETNEAKTVVHSERIQLVGWVGDKLAYVKIAEGESATSQNRHKLMAYNTGSGTDRELVSTNYFNDITQVGDAIYYTPAAFNVNGSVGLFKINIDGNEKRTIYDKEVWNLFRTSYNELSVSMGQEWFTLALDTDTLTKAAGAPPATKSRVYVPNSSGRTSLWTDERDGKSVLLNYDTQTKQDTVLQSRVGIKNPLHWLTSRDVIYRVSNGQETADYVLSVDGGEPRKIKDVTDTAGVDRWYYY